MNNEKEFSFYEFFAGGGMARAGLGEDWQCLFANDIDEKKAASYAANWGDDHLMLTDVGKVTSSDLPDRADLTWASFPCQDLSLAGAGAGIRAERSGTFWTFWKLIRNLNNEGRGPQVVVLENVIGALTSHDGKDFAAIASALAGADYRFGAVVIDAVHFLPQSRPRLFVIGVHPDLEIPSELYSSAPDSLWHSKSLIEAHKGISKKAMSSWIWWCLSFPRIHKANLSDIVEEAPQGVRWHTPQETKRLLNMMTEVNLKKVKQVMGVGVRSIGTIYKRTRNGVQRAEVRFDNIAGCLRTPSGGSSRQTILVVEGNNVRSRLLSPREAARLMGLSDDYKLPTNYNAAYHLAGDGVAVPVVRHLAQQIFEPLLQKNKQRRAVA
jgi:DNA (cytosine-5)-methyltransferase 1